MLKPSPEDLARSLEDAGGLKFLRWRHLHRNQGVATFEWQGQQVQFTAAVVEVLDGEVPEKPQNRRVESAGQHGKIAHLSRKGTVYNEDQLRSHGLPLYLDDDWLLAALKRLGSQDAISSTYGYSNQVISRRLIQMGIETRPRIDPKLKVKMRELRATGMSLQRIADELHTNKASVMRACRGGA